MDCRTSYLHRAFATKSAAAAIGHNGRDGAPNSGVETITAFDDFLPPCGRWDQYLQVSNSFCPAGFITETREIRRLHNSLTSPERRA
jgi:hypothetical protein